MWNHWVTTNRHDSKRNRIENDLHTTNFIASHLNKKNIELFLLNKFIHEQFFVQVLFLSSSLYGVCRNRMNLFTLNRFFFCSVVPWTLFGTKTVHVLFERHHRIQNETLTQNTLPKWPQDARYRISIQYNVVVAPHLNMIFDSSTYEWMNLLVCFSTPSSSSSARFVNFPKSV